jgi:hypothetical protein
MNARFPSRRLVVVALFCCAWLPNLVAAARADDFHVHGTVQYEKILCRNPKTGVGGLQLDQPVLRPVGGARVELVDRDNRVLVAGRTDDKGAYDLTWSGAVPPTAKVRVNAAADNIVVVDHFDPSSVYSVESDFWKLAERETTKDIVARDATRASGPFNILAVLRMGNDLVRSAEPGVSFSQIKVRWTTRHREKSTYFLKAPDSTIGDQAFILGDRDDDSDEFDDFILLHEYGHFLAATYQAERSPGGFHGTPRVDPRVAWSEGWATYFACAVLHDTRYVDTGASNWNGSNVRIEYDVELGDRNQRRADNGYWNERTVSNVLWNVGKKLSDEKNPDAGFTAIWKLLRSDAWTSRSQWRCLHDFCDVLAASRPEFVPQLVEILEAKDIGYRPGKAGDEIYVRPLPNRAIRVGELDSFGESGPNEFTARHVYTFKIVKRTRVQLQMKITGSKTPGRADLDLYLFRSDGSMVARSDADNDVGGTESIDIVLEPGDYFLHVDSWGGRGNSGTYRLIAAY